MPGRSEALKDGILSVVPGANKITPRGDPNYEEKVAGLMPPQLEVALNQSIHDVMANFPPKTGVAIFVYDFGQGGGCGYISNGDRDGMIEMLKEWIARQERKK